jgi:subtilisin-like proprotein convertase family protein
MGEMRMKKRSMFALLGLAMLSALSATATIVTYSGSGGALVDAPDASTPGVVDFDITIPATSVTVNSIVSVTLTGLTHTYVGDTQAYLIDPLYDGTVANAAHAVSLFSPPDDDAAKASAYNIPSGTYAISDYGGGTLNGPRTDFTGSIGAPVAGVWTLELIDYYPGDSGALTSWSVTIDQGEVPEPACLGLAALVGMVGRRRRI